MNNQIAASVCGVVNDAVGDFDVTEAEAAIFTQELVMIARNIDDARALAGFSQQFLHHIIMCLRPVP